MLTLQSDQINPIPLRQNQIWSNTVHLPPTFNPSHHHPVNATLQPVVLHRPLSPSPSSLIDPPTVCVRRHPDRRLLDRAAVSFFVVFSYQVLRVSIVELKVTWDFYFNFANRSLGQKHKITSWMGYIIKLEEWSDMIWHEQIDWLGTEEFSFFYCSKREIEFFYPIWYP